MILRISSIFLLIVLNCYSGESQIIINGLISDSKNNEPVIFAKVFLKKQAVGVISNIKGEFHFKLNSIASTNDTLIVKHLGYEEYRMPISLYKQQYLNIELQEKNNLLGSVDVINYSESTEEALNLLKQIRKNKRKNYANKEVQYSGFYRELLLENAIALKLNECVFNLNYTRYSNPGNRKKSFNNYWDDYYEYSKYKPKYPLSYFAQKWPLFIPPKNKVEIVSSRVNANSGTLNGGFELIGDPLGWAIDLISMDNIKFEFNFFDKKIQDKYVFTISRTERYNDLDCYVLKYYPKLDTNCYSHNWGNKLEMSAFKGEIFVNKLDYAVVAFTSESIKWIKSVDNCNPENIQKSRMYGFVPDKILYNVSYRNIDGRWTLNDIHYTSVHNYEDVVYEWKRDLYLNNHIVKKVENENNITEESLRYKTTTYNSQFWEQYEKSKVFPRLDSITYQQLERNLSLLEQFELLNRKIIDIEKPNTQYNVHSDSLNAINRTTVKKVCSKEDNYASLVLQKLSIEEGRFVSKSRRVLKHSFTEHDTTTTKKTHLKIETDEKQNLYYWELNQNNNYEKVFNITKAYQYANGSIEGVEFTPKYVCYGVKSVSSPNSTLKINLKNKINCIDSIPNISQFIVLNDSLIIYTKNTIDNMRSYQCYIHNIGQEVKFDSLLLEVENSEFDIDIQNTTSNKFVVIYVNSKDRNNYYLLEKSSFSLVHVTTDNSNHISTVDHFANQNYIIVSNFGKNNYLSKVLLENLDHEEVIIRSENQILDFYAFQNKLVYTEYDRFNITMKSFVFNESEIPKAVDFGNDIKSIFFEKTIESTNVLKLTIESIIRPYEEYTIDLSTFSILEKNRDTFQFWTSKGNYVSEVVYAPSHDGVEIPILITYDKHKIKDSIQGILIEAYGAYGSLDYSLFHPEKIAFLAEGFIIARPAVRGSGFYGYDWYQSGTKLNKWNTFYDFIESVRFLKKHFDIETKRIFAKGVSAGGLIMGVMVNNYSEEFGGIILDRPFLDPLNTMSNNLLPLTTLEYSEWGNPNKKENYDYIQSYSPAQNIPKEIKTNLFFRGSYFDYITPIHQILSYKVRSFESLNDNKLSIMKTSLNEGHLIISNYKRDAEEFSFMKYIIDHKE